MTTAGVKVINVIFVNASVVVSTVVTGRCVTVARANPGVCGLPMAMRVVTVHAATIVLTEERAGVVVRTTDVQARFLCKQIPAKQ